ncbi:MAG: glycoside hydrolase family 16 protein, partial [Bacteroidales bacterium]
SVIEPLPGENSDWRKNLSSYEGCFGFSDSNIVLKGIENSSDSTITGETRKYICGGIQSRDKKNFTNGRIEVKAKFSSAQGAWPAIWMMPKSCPDGCPIYAEIDMMEHLNYENIAYQTLHTNYTFNVSKENPLSHVTPDIDKNVYNIYGAEMGEDTVKLTVNGKVTMVYPRNGAKDQFPFNQEFFLIIDMQLGGSWVGEVTGKDLPVEMLIDWVKFYKKEESGGHITVYNGEAPIKSGDCAQKGDKITIKVEPITGYEVNNILINGRDITKKYL